ncbi:MAG: sterol desaturase family protein, partial [Alphaproteobacteria bacterium]|nr:sterol desaturase family protein [Alphaproteobacteria bacterium]
SLQFGVLSQVTGLLTKALSVGIYIIIYSHFAVAHWPMGSVIAWVAALILYDFSYYWLHRMGHEVGILWAAHVVHHSSEYYNLTTALRQTSSGALLGWLFYLPMAIIGVPPVMFFAAGLIDLLYQYWVHTELIGKLGWIDNVLVTPSNHRVHHGLNDYCIDRNYGGILIIWDRLFGTFTPEHEGEKIIYGIRKPLHSYNPIWGNLHVYADLARASWRAKGLRNKLLSWFAPPAGWWGVPLAHFEAEHFSRFAAAKPTRTPLIALSLYTLIALLTLIFLGAGEGWQHRYQYAAALLIAVLTRITAAALTPPADAPHAPHDRSAHPNNPRA